MTADQFATLRRQLQAIHAPNARDRADARLALEADAVDLLEALLAAFDHVVADAGHVVKSRQVSDIEHNLLNRSHSVDAIRAIIGRVERAADVRAASVVLGEPVSGASQVYELRQVAGELRQVIDQLERGTP